MKKILSLTVGAILLIAGWFAAQFIEAHFSKFLSGSLCDGGIVCLDKFLLILSVLILFPPIVVFVAIITRK